MAKKLTHINEAGEAHMVDVGAKADSQRAAVAEGRIDMQAETLRTILEDGNKKGDVLGVARVAGIMASKRAADIVPLCHPLMLNKVSIDLTPDIAASCIHCRAEVAVSGKTGVEIEALFAVQATLLTVYDMCKAMDRDMAIRDTRLMHKSGGKSGTYQREETPS